MRIFLSGAQGVGKSSVVREVAKMEQFKKYEVLDNISSRFMSNKHVQHAYTEGYEDFQSRISLYCLYKYAFSRDLISSRSYFDSLAYPQYSRQLAIVRSVRTYRKLMFEEDCLYFYVPVEFPINANGNPLRSVSPAYQRKIDTLIRKEVAWERKQGKIIHDIRGSVEERVAKVQAVIMDYELANHQRIKELTDFKQQYEKELKP
jgi:tRNA uridine 5-carbamoylmethylation protein Kti12